EHGFSAAWGWMTTPAATSAFWLTVLVAAIAVPLNTIFGVGCALVLVRGRARGRAILDGLIDLPFVVSPVIVGLALILVYGQTGWLGDWFTSHGVRIIYAVPGVVLATVFVSLPFVVREVAPVLREIGDQQEQAAATLGASGWQTFWRITLPSIRWGVAYGVVLTTARALGEIGAVLVVSSNVPGHTLTVPEGSLTALLGPSGSGKSTLLRIIAGLETPDIGAVAIAGDDVTRARPQERCIGFVFQHYAPFAHMSVYENVAFGLRIRKRP